LTENDNVFSENSACEADITENDAVNPNQEQIYRADIASESEEYINISEQYGQIPDINSSDSRIYENKADIPENRSYGNPYAVNERKQVSYGFSEEVQYVPYHEGVLLPDGVSPQLINGMWYYPVPVLKKKKGSVAVKVFMTVMTLLTIFLTVMLILWNAGLKDGNFKDKSGSIFKFELPTEKYAEKSTSAEDIGKYANPDGPEINLTDNNTFAGSTEKAYEKLSISVVSVAVYEKDENPDDDFPISEGTGIIISSDGYMVTNSHVVNDDSKSNVYITTKDGDEFSAVVVGCDVRTDIAVLKANNAENMPPAVFADSEKLKVGQDVVAIGSPGGSSYSNSLTRGIVSALDRNLDGSAVTYIQTDAAINPGNSGGPLANLNGQVVGINTIKIVNTQYEGMGFAIPSVTIKNIADRIIKNGYVADRPQLGIISKEISVTTAKANNTVAGIYVQQIQDKSPLKNTKLKEGDIITKIDNVEVTSFYKLFKVLDSHDIGDKVKVSVCRISKNDSSKKENFELQVTLIGD